MKIRGYVDDGLLTARASKEFTSAAKIQETFAKIEAWATQNGMVFDQAKFEAIHFSRKKHFPNPEICFITRNNGWRGGKAANHKTRYQKRINALARGLF